MSITNNGSMWFALFGSINNMFDVNVGRHELKELTSHSLARNEVQVLASITFLFKVGQKY